MCDLGQYELSFLSAYEVVAEKLAPFSEQTFQHQNKTLATINLQKMNPLIPEMIARFACPKF